MVSSPEYVILVHPQYLNFFSSSQGSHSKLLSQLGMQIIKKGVKELRLVGKKWKLTSKCSTS